ncbi:geranylgeranyl-diphosphate synthase / farnesyl-diphosphate synthase [Methanococcus maripaludis C5]|uniref:Geranylgeranyl-diphosphate synthase / farnesyl-diphosphate synthase n=1 Tax=Methanococcus maripaludis (strain C5 / ATCC BAA-1333) TaxID=402880 RepID=A4G0E8_METM5|nr:polyprenyl synthetase family protein [Methanococcus maripaludis]ABO35932.1 geranylgeranyl-diphosphate synthase / farnesyl-diphosphate synthase [Methanococcus maripaludis C5]
MVFDREILSKIDSELKKYMEKDTKLYGASKHLLLAGGKRVRPYLSIITYLLKKDDITEILAPALSVELIHNYTLVHDDIMDNDDQRRGMPTVHTIYGEPIAILAGDLLYAKAFEALSNIEDSKKAHEVLKVLSKACVEVCEGQTDDMEFEERFPTLDEYFDMISKKTGALIVAPVEIGAVMANCTPEERKALCNYAKRIGMTFQIQDDVLDLIGDQKTIGKPVGSDIVEGKKTMMVIYAMENLSEDKKERLLQILGNKDATADEVSEAIAILADSIEYAKNTMKKATEEAKDYLKIFDAEKRKNLESIADFIIERIH